MSKKVVDGIEVSDDVEVTEYIGKFSGSFELEVEKAVSMAYDDEVVLVVQARLDSYGFKPTKYGDLCRVNTFKVDSVTVKGKSSAVTEIPVERQPEAMVFDEEVEQVHGEVQEIRTAPRVLPAPDAEYAPMIDPSLNMKSDGGRNYTDPLLAKFLEG